jgi:hypothetical protein
MISSATHLSTLVREAGYQLVRIEQLRANRWLVVATSGEGNVLILAQQRPLINSSDVQDLAEQLRLARINIGYLLSIGGRFSPEAQHTAAELRRPYIVLCGSLPRVDQPPLPNTALEIA